MSDADLDLVKAEEGDKLLNAVKELANEATFAFIIIQKDLSTREMLRQVRQLRSQGGSSIINVSCAELGRSKTYPDFYIAHRRILMRTHYVILNNGEFQLPLATLQDWTYCQMFLSKFDAGGPPIVSRVSLDFSFFFFLRSQKRPKTLFSEFCAIFRSEQKFYVRILVLFRFQLFIRANTSSLISKCFFSTVSSQSSADDGTSRPNRI
jgi:hypothetical protein